MGDPSGPPGGDRRSDDRVSAQLTVRFAGPESLAEAVRSYSANLGPGGLCLAVSRTYRPGDVIHLLLEAGGGQLPIQAVVAWCRPGFIGVRFNPTTAAHQETLRFVRRLLGDSRRSADAGASEPLDAPKPTKPFSE
jgi:hypothetical protein